MTDRTIRLTVSAELGAEIDMVAAALGTSAEGIATRALESYLAGVREAQQLEQEHLSRLPTAADESSPLEGDENWLSTLD